MTNIVLNIKPLVDELFRLDIKNCIKSFKNQSKILHEWNSLMKELRIVSLKLSKGEQLGEELYEIRRLATSLAVSATEIGSVIPGPIGMACSVALAIACLFPPMDLLGFLLNLLGAIPFAKGATIGLKPILKNLIHEALQNPMVRGSIRAGGDASRKVVRYNKNYAVNAYHQILSSDNPFNALKIKPNTKFSIGENSYSLNGNLLKITGRNIK